MKKIYTRPDAELQVLSTLDVITFSINFGPDPAKEDIIEEYGII